MTMPLKLLVVDDDATFAEAVSLTLRGYAEVKTARSLDACKKLFTEASLFDLVITDYRMNDGDGHAVLAHARKLVPSIPVIVVTAHAAKEMAIQSINLSVFALLEKPVDFFELTETVKRALEFRGNSQALDSSLRISEISSGSYVLKPIDLSITHSGVKLQLTETEFRILHSFLCAEGKRISREEIIRAVWGTSSLSSNLFDTHLANLRKKVPSLKEDLRVIRGKGYRFSSQSDFQDDN